MSNKISVVIDASVDKAISGFKGFKQSIHDAEGASGKFKAGASSAFESVKGAAAGLALAGGAALVTFGLKAATAFTQTALSAGKFADATGLATEEASRWTAVADDIGISGESMEKAFGKLAVAVGKNNPLLEEFGITVQKGADGNRDMNATMLHAIDVIKGIQDPTKKAAVAQAALGKGWMEMAELIEQGSGTLTRSMAEVSEAQVIDPKEVEKARKMRESLDTLQDSVRDVSLVLGEELVPELALFADGLTKLIDPIMKVHKWSKDLALEIMELTGVIDKQKEAIDPLVFGYGRLATSLDEAGGAGHKQLELQEGLKTAHEEATAVLEEATGGTKDFTGALEANAKATDAARDAHRAFADATFALHDAEKSLAESLATVDERLTDAEGNLYEQRSILEGVAKEAIAVADAQVRIADETATANGHVMSAKEKADLYRAALVSQAAELTGPAKDALLDYIATLDLIPATKSTTIMLNQVGFMKNARGTNNFPGGVTLVGEEGPELVALPAGSAIHPAGETQQMLNGFITPHSMIAAGWGSGGAGATAAGASVTLVVEGNIYGDKQLQSTLNTWARGVQRELDGAQ